MKYKDVLELGHVEFRTLLRDAFKGLVEHCYRKTSSRCLRRRCVRVMTCRMISKKSSRNVPQQMTRLGNIFMYVREYILQQWYQDFI